VEEKVSAGGLQALSPTDVEELQRLSGDGGGDRGRRVPAGPAPVTVSDALLRIRNRARIYLALLRTEKDFDDLSAGLPDYLRDAWRQLMAEELAYLSQEEDLVRTHKGQYVAIHQGHVVASALTESVALSEAYEKCGNVTVYVHKVGALREPVAQLSVREA
jgi:hypothetical protein